MQDYASRDETTGLNNHMMTENLENLRHDGKIERFGSGFVLDEEKDDYERLKRDGELIDYFMSEVYSLFYSFIMF